MKRVLYALILASLALAPAIAQTEDIHVVFNHEMSLAPTVYVLKHFKGLQCGPYFAARSLAGSTNVLMFAYYDHQSAFVALMPAKSLNFEVDETKAVPTATPIEADATHDKEYFTIKLSSRMLAQAQACIPTS